MKIFRQEQGFALVLVLLALLTFGICTTVLYSAYRAQGNVGSMSENSIVALTKAENGLTLAISKMNKGENIGSGFSYNDGGWNVVITNNSGVLQSRATRGRYSRTVAVDVSTISQNTDWPFDKFSFMSDGLMLIENGSYFFNSNLYATEGFVIPQTAFIGSGTFSTPGTVEKPSWLNIDYNEHAPVQTISEPDWSKFEQNATVVKTVSGNNTLDISNELKAALNSSEPTVIVVKASSSGNKTNPKITLGGWDFKGGKDSQVTIVVLKDSENVTPELIINNGNYQCDLNTFVQGKISVNSCYDKTIGVMYATDEINLTNASFDLQGGVVSKTGIRFSSAYLKYTPPDESYWDKYRDFFPGSGSISISITNWREL